MYSKFTAHPWHGIPAGEQSPEIVNTFIEIVPTDTVKYEIDKESGFLKVDRPQKFSNFIPSLYGFVPQTYCDENVAALAREHSPGYNIEKGDGDPLDICVLTEKIIHHGYLILKSIPIGGIRLIDKGEADDKIISVLVGDEIYGKYRDISELPEGVVNRLKHYFLTYKNIPGETKNVCEISGIYGREEAHEVIRKSQLDYEIHYQNK
ncbi:MAG TPA: inorganic pyrophosphatase [Chitinophagales bacterium]|nr:inorganic pyrophosphatase [Chitinophagales bacterium]